MRNYCEREGWNVLGEYVDEGASAAKESALQRPEFRRMLDDAENQRIDVLVVHKLDRFSRNLSVTVQTLAKLDSWGADFVSLSEQIDPKTPMGRLMLKFMASLAEWYSDNLSTEVAKGRRERAEQGLPNGDIPGTHPPPAPRSRQCRSRARPSWFESSMRSTRPVSIRSVTSQTGSTKRALGHALSGERLASPKTLSGTSSPIPSSEEL
jgi:DNA invertase Pin-like site-specific DNA recombinase